MSDQILPPEVSADAKRNAYTMLCEVVECRMHYAVCQSRLSKGSYFDNRCDRALNGPRCVASTMQKEEREKGRAIYFLERAPFTGIKSLVDKARKVIDKVLPPVTPGAGGQLPGDYMAVAINAAFKDEAAAKAKIEPKAPLAAIPKALPGESMVEMGRRLLAERASKKA